MSEEKTIERLADEICGRMQMVLKNSGIDFANSNLDIECAKQSVKFAISVNKDAGI